MGDCSQERNCSYYDDDLFEIELSENRKKMLEHYLITGDILQQSPSSIHRLSQLSNPSQGILNALSTINQVDEQYLQSVYYIPSKTPEKSEIHRLTFIDKLELREENIKKHQKFIVSMMLQLKLIQGMDGSLGHMLQEAELNYAARTKSYSSQNIDGSKSSTTMVMTSNPSQLNLIKRQLASELAESLFTLTNKKSYKKYCYHAYKTEKIQGSFALDFKHFVYKVQGKDSIKADSMEQYKGFSLGRVSKNFKKYLKKNEDPQDNLSFSLIFHNRTLDLSASTPQQRNEFLSALQELQRYL